MILHCVKSVRIRSHSGPHFPAFGLNTKKYRVFLYIQSECGKMRTRITPNTDTFYAVLKFRVPLNLTSSIYRLLYVSNTVSTGSAITNIIKRFWFIGYWMYICLSSSCLYRLLNLMNLLTLVVLL